MSTRFGAGRVKRSLLHFFAGKVASAVGGLTAVLMVVHGLTVREFAAYSVLVGLVEMFTAVSGLGLQHVVLRYVPELYARYQQHALRQLVGLACALRSVLLFVLLSLAWWLAPVLAGWIGLGDLVDAFRVFLLVVGFRSLNQFLSMILESMLHQGISQLAFSLVALGRCWGMMWLTGFSSMNLLNVIWVECVCEIVATIIMLVGIVRSVRHGVADGHEGDQADDDPHWLRHQRPVLVKFAGWAYLQHLATLPFGGTTNRLVGGAMFGSMTMASFGFALSIYDYAKRYLPTQLLIGLIRPVVVARYATTGSFTRAAELCEQAMQFNLVLLAAMLAALAVSGDELLGMISNGKYMESSVIMLATLLVVLVLETQRVVLDVLTQMVNHYEILVSTNLFLSSSVVGGIVGYAWLGALAFPLANLAALVIAIWRTDRTLAGMGFVYKHDWTGAGWSLMSLLISTAAGRLARYAGLDWVSALIVAMLVFALFFVKLQLKPTLGFARDMIGSKQSKG
ncbi:hypothetical protein GJ699_23830 [Duganella sp. FT80W]|uniref:Oligosaccharide flippase family protein n=1 Tax=Duganella guangzhouensis TaxID=2666084 RepID=A0A6I2L5G2_9BURK|nr:hypothetical protein [Duganella guangzhouensis]MRW93033.1 hypothetical protein [Duganella guangzhouensis]